MKKNKTTKRALLSSVIALMICLAMLMGTTYAWFTDSAASSGNVIKSGTLNIDLLVKGGETGYTDYTSIKASSAPVFNYQLWEPGYTDWANVKVTTTGNLALKYTMRITAEGTVSELGDVIDVYYAPSEIAQPATRPADLATTGLTRLGTLSEVLAGTVTVNDTLIPGSNTEDFATIALHMQETAGNEYQDKELGSSFSIQILATQYTYEEDNFDDQYDLNAEWPGEIHVSTMDDFNEAIKGNKYGTVILSEDISTNKALTVGSASSDKTIDLNGHTLSLIGQSTARIQVEAGKTVVVKDSAGTGKIIVARTTPTAGGVSTGFKVANAASKLVLDNVNIEVTAGKGTTPSAIAADASKGTLEINGGTIVSNDIGVRGYGDNASSSPTVIINGTTITAASKGVYTRYADVTINNAAITADEDAVFYGGNGVTVTLNGGTYTGTNGYAVNFGTSSSSDKVLNITAGTLTGGTGDINQTTGSTVNDSRS